jgi:hypothetical protein
MPRPRTTTLAVRAALAGIFVLLPSGRALSDDSVTAGSDVTLTVQRVVPPAGREGGMPQYLCTARIQRVASGEVLAQPRIQTGEGVEASIYTTTDSGIKVSFKVLVSTPTRVTYEVQIAPPGAAPERHRAAIAMPE